MIQRMHLCEKIIALDRHALRMASGSNLTAKLERSATTCENRARFPWSFSWPCRKASRRFGRSVGDVNQSVDEYGACLADLRDGRRLSNALGPDARAVEESPDRCVAHHDLVGPEEERAHHGDNQHELRECGDRPVSHGELGQDD